VLLAFCDGRGIDLEGRILRRDFFAPNELDAIRDACQKRFAEPNRQIDPKSTALQIPACVGKSAEYTRLTEIAEYLHWYSQILLRGRVDRETSTQIRQMVAGLKVRRPRNRKRNQLKRQDGFDDSQMAKLWEVVTAGSESNPFIRPDIQLRNYVMVAVLAYVGNRGGELLNIRTTDFDSDFTHIIIARRHDEADDTRLYQPLVKTLDRKAPINPTLAKLILQYIKDFRNKVPNARRHDYLFVTHKEGPTQGQPISISAYQKMFRTIASTASELADLHGHALRHTWNRKFSELMDAMKDPPSPEKQEQIRSYLQGWMEGSGTAAAYNKRFNEWKAMQAGLTLQQSMIRVPENLHYAN
jgi:integrase